MRISSRRIVANEGGRGRGRERGKKEDRYSPGVPLTVTIPAASRRDRRRRRRLLRLACRARLSLPFAIDVEDAASSRIPRTLAPPALLFTGHTRRMSSNARQSTNPVEKRASSRERARMRGL